MRRKDREKDASFAFEVLRDSEYVTLATINSDGTPYCIPISAVLVGNALYFHCAAEGQKLTNINKNSAVCLSGVRYAKTVPENFTTEYESAVASGSCKIVQNEEEKIMAMRALCEKYATDNMENFDAAMAKSFHRVTVCRVDIVQITGKSNLNF